MEKKKVTIELTPDQRKKIKDETGKELSSLEFDALEDRDAPKILKGGGSDQSSGGRPQF
ncbi:MAG: hypothetical protein ACE5IM_10045 [Nitrospinota bacterium]